MSININFPVSLPSIKIKNIKWENLRLLEKDYNNLRLIYLDIIKNNWRIVYTKCHKKRSMTLLTNGSCFMRIDLSILSVSTYINHPRCGLTLLRRKKLSVKEVRKVLSNPRYHIVRKEQRLKGLLFYSEKTKHPDHIYKTVLFEGKKFYR